MLSEKRNPVQKILHQPERAQPSADKPPKQASKQEEKAHHPERDCEPLLIQQCLQRPDRAGRNCPGTGITIQSRNTGILQVPLINFSVQETICVPISDYGIYKLHGQT